MKMNKDKRTLIYRAQLGLSFVLLMLAFLTANSIADESKERVLNKSMKPSRAYSLIMRQPDFASFKEMGYVKESKAYIFRYLTKDGTEKVEYLESKDPFETNVSEK